MRAFVFANRQQAKKEVKPADPFKEKKLNLSSKLRDIIGFHRNDPTTPNPATKALETAVSPLVWSAAVLLAQWLDRPLVWLVGELVDAMFSCRLILAISHQRNTPAADAARTC